MTDDRFGALNGGHHLEYADLVIVLRTESLSEYLCVAGNTFSLRKSSAEKDLGRSMVSRARTWIMSVLFVSTSVP